MAKILVVDDEMELLNIVKLLLCKIGHTVTGLCNAKDILKSAKKFMPDVILLDVKLSGRDGRELCKQLKSNIFVKKIPVILFSAVLGIKETYQKFNASDFISKPFDCDELIKTIEKYIKAV